VHEAYPTKLPVYPVVSAVQEIQALFVESQPYPSLHDVHVPSVHAAQLAV